jgi:nucleosome binding factor SPN SPT16 subunit
VAHILLGVRRKPADCRTCALLRRRNIKHAFFQPAENEMITLVHFHLINPIMASD